MQRPEVTPELIAVLAETAGLDLSADYQRELIPHLEAVWADFERLREVDVGAYEPASIFRALPVPERGMPR